MLWALLITVVVLWIVGSAFQLGDGLIRLLLIGAVVGLAFHLVTGRPGRV